VCVCVWGETDSFMADGVPEAYSVGACAGMQHPDACGVLPGGSGNWRGGFPRRHLNQATVALMILYHDCLDRSAS